MGIIMYVNLDGHKNKLIFRSLAVKKVLKDNCKIEQTLR